MKTQKQSRVDSLEKKMAATTNVLQHMMSELAYIKDLCIGTLETIKQMPDYEEAIQKLKEKVAEKPGQRKLTPVERLSNRLGYMGTAFMMMSPHILPDHMGMVTYIIAGVISIPQVFVAKQWNLVAVNLNVAIAYIILYLS